MKNKTIKRSILATFVMLAFAAVAPSEAYARGRSTTVNGARGGTYQREVSKTPGKVSASTSATLPNGKTASRSVSSEKTDTGRTTSAQATGFNGKTATYDSTRTKTDTGYVRQAEATGPNGATASKEVVVTKQDGVVTRTATTTKTPAPKP